MVVTKTIAKHKMCFEVAELRVGSTIRLGKLIHFISSIWLARYLLGWTSSRMKQLILNTNSSRVRQSSFSRADEDTAKQSKRQRTREMSSEISTQQVASFVASYALLYRVHCTHANLKVERYPPYRIVRRSKWMFAISRSFLSTFSLSIKSLN